MDLDDFDRDRSELGDGFLPESEEEAAELALRRAAATGRPVIVGAFTGGETLTVFDVVDGELELAGRVFAEHPSPSLLFDAIDEEESG
jgi:hypothetical protein